MKPFWAVLLLLAGTALAVPPREMSVQVRSGQLRATPSYLGRPVAVASYGERVAVLAAQGDWFQVRGASGGGWIHKSALSAKKIVLRAGAADVAATASGQELSLAGKGFNAAVEADFKKRNANIDFGPIDLMESIRITPAEVRAFLEAGGLKGGGP